MALHIVAAIFCIILAALLVSFAVDEWNTAPSWLSGLAIVATVILLVSAARIYLGGVRRRRETMGPRTKIVLEPSTPPVSRERKSSDHD